MKSAHLYLIALHIFFSCQSVKEDNESDSKMENIEPPSGGNSSLPYLIKGEDGFLYMSWVERRDSVWIDLKYSVRKDDGWQEPELIAVGNDWFVNWADYPMIAVDENGNMVAHYLAKSSAGTYSYDVNVVYKPAGGQWSAPIVPHDDGTPTEHGFVTMLPQNDGSFLMAWLDGRNTGGGDHDSHDDVAQKGAMTLRSAVIDMNGQITLGVELDQRVCDCCQTGGIMTAQGPIFAYRDRSDTEVRDISFVRRVNNDWAGPAIVSTDNWKIAGCPVNGPRMASKGNTTAVAWFTAADQIAKVKVAFMGDSEKLFNEPTIIDDSVSVGRVDVVMLNDQEAVVSWLDLDNGTPYIKFRRANRDGGLSESMIVSQTSASRKSGFPQMEYVSGSLYFAWTNIDQEKTSISLKRVEW